MLELLKRILFIKEDKPLVNPAPMMHVVWIEIDAKGFLP